MALSKPEERLKWHIETNELKGGFITYIYCRPIAYEWIKAWLMRRLAPLSTD